MTSKTDKIFIQTMIIITIHIIVKEKNISKNFVLSFFFFSLFYQQIFFKFSSPKSFEIDETLNKKIFP